MLTTKNLVSISHYTVDFSLPISSTLCPFPSHNHYSVLCIYLFVFVWFGLFILFFLVYLLVCFFIFPVNHQFHSWQFCTTDRKLRVYKDVYVHVLSKSKSPAIRKWFIKLGFIHPMLLLLSLLFSL